MIGCKSENGVVSGMGSVTESQSESDRSEGFVFLPTPLQLQSLTILCELVKRNRKNKRKNQPITELIPSPDSACDSESTSVASVNQPLLLPPPPRLPPRREC